MTELNSKTMNTVQFARLLLTLQPLLQKVELEGSEMPPLEELLRFANAQRINYFFLTFPVLTMLNRLCAGWREVTGSGPIGEYPSCPFLNSSCPEHSRQHETL